jgi:predicted ATP-dependent endonuclease of OLD family
VLISLIGVSQEKTVVFVGEKSSGKSSLIAKFLDDPVKDDMKETTALDFRYGIRTKDEKKQKVNIYELGKKLSLSSSIMLINTFEHQ